MSALTNLGSKLKAIGINEKMRKKLAHLALNNPDPMSVTDEAEANKSAVSLKVFASTRDRELVRLLQHLRIYNLLKYKTEKGIWYFFIIFHPHRICNVNIDRMGYERPVLFEEAVGMAILQAIEERDTLGDQNVVSGEEAKAEMFPTQMTMGGQHTSIDSLPLELQKVIRETIPEFGGTVSPNIPTIEVGSESESDIIDVDPVMMPRPEASPVVVVDPNENRPLDIVDA